jgi:hypothetical protein
LGYEAFFEEGLVLVLEGVVVSGEESEGYRMFFACLMEGIDSVGPIAFSSEDSGDDEACVGEEGVNEVVDVMFIGEVHEVECGEGGGVGEGLREVLMGEIGDDEVCVCGGEEEDVRVGEGGMVVVVCVCAVG